MNLKQYIPDRVSNLFSPNNTQNASTKKKMKRISDRLQQGKIFITEAEQKDLKDAIIQAENTSYPSRVLLYAIYKETMRDFHLRSQVRTAILKVVSEPWALVNKKTKEVNKEATEILQKKWFEDCSKYKLEAEFYGHSLMEFKELVPTEDVEQRKISPFEFKRVALIPREHVRPETGEILIQPHDNEGIPYRDTTVEGVDWLIEAGDFNDLGLLEIAARYSIYKKYAFGDMAKSSEKWGDPLLAIKNSSDDEKETNKKAEMASNFGNNSWIILDDDDGIELLERKNGAGYKIFTDLMKASNEENSKGINGQVATADEKAFVGAAEVQERLLDDYTEARLRSLFYWHNDVTIPFLIKKGYKLEGLVWMPLGFLPEMEKEEEEEEPPEPDKETPPAPVKKEKKPKPKNKSNGGASMGKSQGLGDKSFTQAINDFYTCSCGTVHLAPNSILNAIDMDLLIAQGIRRHYDGKIKSGGIDRNLANANIERLTAAVNKGYDTSKMKFGNTEHRIYMQMRYNSSVTMAFKQYQNSLEVTNQLFDNGKIKPFHKFKKDVKPLLETFNKNHLKTEYNLAKSSARMGQQWANYDDDDILQYKTIGDGRVRDEHVGLHNTTLPKSDSFWTNYYPPNGWGCRCYVRKKRKGTETKEPQLLPEVKEDFKRNVGVDGKVFDELTHPYFDIKPEHRKQAERLWGLGMPISPQRFLQNVKTFNKLSQNKNYVLVAVDNESGGAVFKHLKADKKDLKLNIKAARRLSTDKGLLIQIRKHVLREGGKNPEFRINGKLSDLKTITGNIKNAFNYATEQEITTFVLDIQNGKSINIIAEQIRKGFHYNNTIDDIYVFYKSETLFLTKQDIKNDRIEKILKGM